MKDTIEQVLASLIGLLQRAVLRRAFAAENPTAMPADGDRTGRGSAGGLGGSEGDRERAAYGSIALRLSHSTASLRKKGDSWYCQ